MESIYIGGFGRIDFYIEDGEYTEDGYLYYAEGPIEFVQGWFDEASSAWALISIDSDSFELEKIELVFPENHEEDVCLIPEDIDSEPIVIKKYFAAMDCGRN